MRASKKFPVAPPEKQLVLVELAASTAAVNSQISDLNRYARELAQASDADLPRFHALAESIRNEQIEALGAIMTSCKQEIQRRILARGGKEIIDKEFLVKLEEQFTAYVYDIELLKQAQALLPDADAAKILKHYDAYTHTVTEPERWEPGSAVSMLAIIKRDPSSTVAKLLKLAMKRDSLGYRVIIKPHATIASVKNVTRNGASS